MALKVIWMAGEHQPDQAIVNGLRKTECEIKITRTISDTMAALSTTIGDGDIDVRDLLLVAEVQAGAIPLLSLLTEQGTTIPPTLLYDREGNDIRNAIVAFRMGVRDYLLSSDTENLRERRAWVLAERIIHRSPEQGRGAGAGVDFQWNEATNVIRIGDDYVHLSPSEGRVFGLLHAHRGHVVPTKMLIKQAFLTDVDEQEGKRMLRVRMAYLRNKLSQNIALASLVINVRGQGYMLK